MYKQNSLRGFQPLCFAFFVHIGYPHVKHQPMKAIEVWNDFRLTLCAHFCDCSTLYALSGAELSDPFCRHSSC